MPPEVRGEKRYADWDTAASVVALERIADTWNEADPGLPAVVASKQALARTPR
jgi:hypothetical protein